MLNMLDSKKAHYINATVLKRWHSIVAEILKKKIVFYFHFNENKSFSHTLSLSFSLFFHHFSLSFLLSFLISFTGFLVSLCGFWFVSHRPLCLASWSNVALWGRLNVRKNSATVAWPRRVVILVDQWSFGLGLGFWNLGLNWIGLDFGAPWKFVILVVWFGSWVIVRDKLEAFWWSKIWSCFMILVVWNLKLFFLCRGLWWWVDVAGGGSGGLLLVVAWVAGLWWLWHGWWDEKERKTEGERGRIKNKE